MAIEREKVIDQMSKVSAEANEDGLIPAFNVLVNQWPAKFWNEFSKRMVEAVDDDIKDYAQNGYIGIEAVSEEEGKVLGYQCSYNAKVHSVSLRPVILMKISSRVASSLCRVTTFSLANNT